MKAKKINKYIAKIKKYGVLNLVKIKFSKLINILFTLRYKYRFGRIGKLSILKKPLALFNVNNIYIGNNTVIEFNATLYSVKCFGDHLYNGKIHIGNNCYINHTVNISSAVSVTIEDDVTLAFNVAIFDHNHGIDTIGVNYNKQPLNLKETVIIGRGAWVGANCFIMASVGRGSIVGANSVVTKNIPDYVVAVGNPATIIKKYDFKAQCWVKA